MNIAELFFNYGYYKYFNEKRFLRKISLFLLCYRLNLDNSILKIRRYRNDINVKHTYMYDKDRL